MNRFITLILSLGITFISFSVAALQVTATVSQNPAYAGQPFTLQVSADASLPASAFDSSSLLHQSLVVGQTSTSRSMNDINGKTSSQTQWVTTLLARTPGDYQIPAFTIKGHQSKPFILHVIANPGHAPIQQQVHVEVSLSHQQAWIGQSLLYTAKILVASSLNNANFSPPKLAHAKVEQVGNDQQRTEIINGRRYRTLIRHWLITPEDVGVQTILGPKLTGVAGIIDPTFGMSELPIEVQGKSLSVHVNAKPAQASGHWLAASQVTLNDDLSPKQSTYRPGQAITRTVTVTLTGAGLQQLPDLTRQYPAGLRVYPDKNNDHLFIKDGHIYAQRTLNIALIPVRSGTMRLPAIQIPWWNIKTHRLEYASLAAQTITVDGAAQAATTSPNNQSAAPGSPSGHSSGWLTGLLALLWVLTLAGWGFREWRWRQAPGLLSPADAPMTATGQSWQSFREAAKANQPQAAEQALRRYLQSHPQVATQLTDLISELAKTAWDPKADTWDGKAFLERVNQRLKQPADKGNRAQKVPPLNPS